MATFLATWGAPGPRVFHAPVVITLSTVVKPGPVDSPRIAEGFYRRKKRKKRKKALETVEPVETTHVVVSVATTVESKPPDFRTLAELSGRSIEDFRAEVNQEIAALMRKAQEDDDEEALTMILTMLED